MNFPAQCGKNCHMDIFNFATLRHTKKLIHCVAIFTILYGNYYRPHREFDLICIGKFVRQTWANFDQQYGKNRQRCQQNKFYYAVWQLLLYYYRESPSKILSLYRNWYHSLTASNFGGNRLCLNILFLFFSKMQIDVNTLTCTNFQLWRWKFYWQCSKN